MKESFLIKQSQLLGDSPVAAVDENPYDVGASVEQCIFDTYKRQVSKEYKAKVRTLLFNLKDPKNPDLRRRVLCGEVPPEVLVVLTSEELASNDKRAQNDKIRCALPVIC